MEDEKPVGAFGVATYRLYVKGLPERRLNLNIKQVLCAANVFVNDSLVAVAGKVAETEEDYYPQYITKIIEIPDGLKEFF